MTKEEKIQQLITDLTTESVRWPRMKTTDVVDMLKIIQAIEPQSKWINIKRFEDLPKEKKLFKFVSCNNFDEEFIGWIDNEFDEVFFIDFKYYQIKKEDGNYSVKNNAWLTSQITHYKEIL